MDDSRMLLIEQDRAAEALVDALLVRLADFARSAAARRGRQEAPAPVTPAKEELQTAAWGMVAQMDAARPQLEALFDNAAALKVALE